MISQSIHWPVIVKYAADDELEFIHDQHHWEQNIETGKLQLDESDVVIDEQGEVYCLIKNTTGHSLEPKGKQKTLEEVLGLVKAHAAQAGSCCVAKLYAPTIKDALNIVMSMNND